MEIDNVEAWNVGKNWFRIGTAYYKSVAPLLCTVKRAFWLHSWVIKANNIKQLYVAKICQPVSADSSLIALPKDSYQNWNGSQLRLLDDFSHVHGTCLPTEAQATHKELLSPIQITAKRIRMIRRHHARIRNTLIDRWAKFQVQMRRCWDASGLYDK